MLDVLKVHAIASPIMTGLTYAFITVRAEDRQWWDRAVIVHAVRHLGLGVALGSGVYLMSIGVASRLGWVHFGGDGLQNISNPEVVQTLITHLANLCVAWDEEMLYRGYG